MAVLWAAVAVIGLLCTLDLLLSVGIIRRLREQTADIATLRSAGHTAANGVLPTGSVIADVTGATTTGRPVSLSGPTVVGLFLTDCGPCKALLPSFVEYAERSDLPVLAVITGEPDLAGPLVESLGPVADVVLDGHDGPVASAFQATSFPLVYLVEDGRIAAGGRELGALPVAATAGSGRPA